MSHLDYTIRHHLQLFDVKYANTVERIRSSLYVDDLTSGYDSVEGAWKLYKETKFIFAEAAMNIRNWRTNDPVLAERIKIAETQQTEAEEDNYVADTLNPEEIAPVKVLGVPWDIKRYSCIYTSAFEEIYCQQDNKTYIIESNGICIRSLRFLVTSCDCPEGAFSKCVQDFN